VAGDKAARLYAAIARAQGLPMRLAVLTPPAYVGRTPSVRPPYATFRALFVTAAQLKVPF